MLPFGPGVGTLGQVHPSLPPSQPVPPASRRDEDLQLRLALRLSRQERKVVGRASCAAAAVAGGATRALTRLFPLPVVVLLPLTSRRLPPYTLGSSQGPPKSSLGCSRFPSAGGEVLAGR